MPWFQAIVRSTPASFPTAMRSAEAVGDIQQAGVEVETLLDTAKTWIEYLARGVEIAAALIIGIAAVQATLRSMILFFRPSAPPEAKNGVRLTLGRWLAVALELELAADILNTAVTPTWTDIEKLAAIAALRTALNYFLEKEIEQEAKPSTALGEVRVGEAMAASTPNISNGAAGQVM